MERRVGPFQIFVGCFSAVGVVFTIIGVIVAIAALFYPRQFAVTLENILPTSTPLVITLPTQTPLPTPTRYPTPTSYPSPTPYPTSTPYATHTPYPTYTTEKPPSLSPTPTLTPSSPSTPTALPDTPLTSVLNVGETWTQKGFQLTLKEVELTAFLGEGTVHLFFAVKNRTGTPISAALDAKNIAVVDNRGNRFRLGECSGSEQVRQINLDPGEYDELLLCGRYYIVFRGNYFDPSVFELTVRVTDWSRIQEARWRIPIYH